jgi:hypothetical protein
MPDAVTLAAVWMVADDGGGEAKKAGPIALVVILLLCIACYFLFRSMARHLRKVRDEFPSGEDGQDPSDTSSNGPPGHGPSAP